MTDYYLFMLVVSLKRYLNYNKGIKLKNNNKTLK